MKSILIFVTLLTIAVIATDASVAGRSRHGSRCPNGQRMVFCYVWPCWGWKCGSDPGLKCVADYCGGCNRKWKDRHGNEVDCASPVARHGRG